MVFSSIHFIVNPISGKGKGAKVIKLIQKLFPKSIIKVTTGKNDAYNFSIQSIKENADLIVSCGGDGTLNEVASALIHRNIPLAIVPIGSGNGLARHLGIPLDYKKALSLIQYTENIIEKIDCGKMNQHYFFSNLGIGFDAEVVKTYSEQNRRKLSGYLKCIFLSLFKFCPPELYIKNFNFEFKGKVMLLNISNSNCLGYGFSISPAASLKDGLFDVNLIPNSNWAIFSWIGLGFLLKKQVSKKQKFFLTDYLEIKTNSKYIQLDGEYYPIKNNEIIVSNVSASLTILIK